MKKRVPRSKAVHKSGPKKGKLRKGCQFIKGGAAVCTVSKPAKRKATKRKATKRRATKRRRK